MERSTAGHAVVAPRDQPIPRYAFVPLREKVGEVMSPSDRATPGCGTLTTVRSGSSAYTNASEDRRAIDNQFASANLVVPGRADPITGPAREREFRGRRRRPRKRGGPAARERACRTTRNAPDGLQRHVIEATHWHATDGTSRSGRRTTLWAGPNVALESSTTDGRITPRAERM